MSILQKLARQIPGIVYQFRLRPDGSTCVPYASEASREIYRLAPEEVREDASKVFAHVHPDDQESHLASIHVSARDMTPWQHEYRLKFDDGTVRWLSGNALPQREADGSTLWHGFIADITQSKQAEEEFKKFLDLIPDLVCITSIDGRFLKINSMWQEALGYTEQEILATHLLDLIHPDDRGATRKEMERQLAGNASMQFINRYCHKDGSYRWLEWRGMPSVDRKLLFASARDITGRKQAEEKIEKSMSLLQATLESTHDAILVVDLDGIWVLYNQQFVDMWNITYEVIVAGDDNAALAYVLDQLEDANAFLNRVRELYATPEANSFDVIKLKDGRIIERNSLPQFVDGKVEGRVWNFRDITERELAEASIRAEQEIMASRAAVRKLAAHTEELHEGERKLIAREVHDELGQVLSVLRMDIALLKDRSGMNNAVMDGIGRNMLALVDRAIKSVRNVAGSLRPPLLDMGVIAAIEGQCAKFAEDNCIPCTLDAVSDIGDRFSENQALALFRIVQESLANVKRHAAATRVEISIAASNGVIGLEIRDNGKGFDPEKLAESESFGLLGMRERAISIGGELNVTSSLGQGTAVTLCFHDGSAGDIPNSDRRLADRRAR